MDIVTRLEKTEELLKNHSRANAVSINALETWKFKNLVNGLANNEKIWSVNSWGFTVSVGGKLKSYRF